MATAVEEVLRGTARAATYNVVLQVSFRLLTFVVNALVLRVVASELLGLVNVRLTLLYSTILFLSREAFRKACLSRPHGTNTRNWRHLINLTWCCVPVGIISGLFLSIFWIFCLEEPSEIFNRQYKMAVVVFAISAVTELLVEPLWLLGQTFLFIRARVLIEAFSLAAKCITTITLIIIFPGSSLIAFCVAQMCHAFCYLSLYYGFFTFFTMQHAKTSSEPKTKETENFPLTSIKDILPDFSLQHQTNFDPLYGKLVFSFLKQSVLKQFLTEGERYIMTIFNVINFSQQGVYDIINNLGSLVARFVFLPIEDSYYVLFCHLLVRGKLEQDQGKLRIAGRTLTGVVKFMSLTGCIILVFGYSYSHLLLDIYGGKLLSSSEGPLLLRWYCVYVLIIAINGITECFMFALMKKEEIDFYNRKMVIFSIAFLAASLLLTKIFGSVGFILANCFNMFLRITHSAIFIEKFFASSNMRPLRGILPSTTVAVSLMLSFFVTATSEQAFCCDYGWLNRFIHIIVGAVCLFSVLISIFITENEFISFLKEQWTGRYKKDN